MHKAKYYGYGLKFRLKDSFRLNIELCCTKIKFKVYDEGIIF